MVSLEAITPYAIRVTQLPDNENARSNFILRLQLVVDPDVLRALANRFALNPEAAVPVWRRLATLSPDDMKVKLEAAYVFYSNGIDADALRLVDEVLALDEKVIAAWELKAALCADPKDRRRIFESILKIDPGNRTAVDNLIILGRPTA